MGKNNIELKQTRQVNEKELGMILLPKKKTNSILLVKLKKIPHGSLANYFFLDIPLYKDFYIPWFFTSKVIKKILGKIKSTLVGLAYFTQT